MDVSWIFWWFPWIFDEFFACSGAASTQFSMFRALGKMPCATICCTCKKQLTARTNSPILDTEIHLEVRLLKKLQHRAAF